jgi:hypothetical protein
MITYTCSFFCPPLYFFPILTNKENCVLHNILHMKPIATNNKLHPTNHTNNGPLKRICSA